MFNASLDADTIRTIEILEDDAIDGDALQALVREAVAYNGRQGGTAPVLLAGGNPQIAKGDGDAPVQAYIAAMPGWKREVGRRLDTLIAEHVPEVRKAVRWNSPFYGDRGARLLPELPCLHPVRAGDVLPGRCARTCPAR